MASNWTEEYRRKGRIFIQNFPEGNISLDSSFDVPYLLQQSKIGQKNEKWRERKARGEFVASPYTCYFSRIRSTPVSGSISCTRTASSSNPVSYTSTFSGNYSYPWLASGFQIPVEVRNKALSRILEKIRNEYQHASALPALAEIGSTIRMFGSPFSSLTRFTQSYLDDLHLKRKKIKGRTTKKRRQSWSEIVSSSYLEYSFGLKPLIQDTRTIAEALARWNVEGGLPLKTVLTASATSDEVLAISGDYHGPGGSNAFIGRSHLVAKTEFGVRYVVQVDHSLNAQFGSLERLMQLLGFTPAEFVPTIWEVIPWSWLVDYFVNVQDILEAGFTNTSAVKGICLTERVKYLSTLSHLIDYAEAERLDAIDGHRLIYSAKPKDLGTTQYERTEINRTVPSSLGLPDLTVSYPNSIGKLANMAAVLVARRSKTRSWVPD